MAPSQLAQLKSALSSAGLNRQSHSKKDKKAFKKGGARETDRQKKIDKLDEIRRNLNKFDERETKVKHDVGGRNLKGVTGRPSSSKQAGLEQRRKTLLPEHQLKDHRGTFHDRRFGENDPSMSIEDRMLERYTRERQRGQGKKGLFNLEDDEEDPFGGLDEGTALGGLTHGGRSVTDLPGDDFIAQGLGDDDDPDEDVAKGRIDKRQVSQVHFGGFEPADDSTDLPEKKKSKQEVMAEIIAKSKEHKHERQQQREMDDDLRDQLDDEMADLQKLLAEAPSAPDTSHLNVNPRNRPPAATAPGAEAIDDGEYDQVVRSLAFEARAKPKDRTKSEEELAKEERDRLEQAESRRLRRMRGESVSDDEGAGEGSRKRKRANEKPDADDLEDDYVENDSLLGPGLTREQIEDMELSGEGSGSEGSQSDGGLEEDDSEEDDDLEDELDGSDIAMEEAGSESESGSGDESGVLSSKQKARIPKVRRAPAKIEEIPYTFKCPQSIEEFEDILAPLKDDALPIVVQRIQSLHHPSLAEGNKEKLQNFLGVLIDYILIFASEPLPTLRQVEALAPHITYLIKLNPMSAAGHFVNKLNVMQKNLARGLAQGSTRAQARTFPGLPELSLLRLVGLSWSTSDFSHPVVAPAVLLMGQYISQSRVRKLSDVASGLFVCSLLVQFEARSKRVLPEVVNFVASTILMLLPRKKASISVQTYPDITVPSLSLYIKESPSDSLTTPVNIVPIIGSTGSEDGAELELQKCSLLLVALRLVDKLASLYIGTPAFTELMAPVKQVLEGSRTSTLPDGLKGVHKETLKTLSRTVTNSLVSRRPLALQAHKPIPIASHTPKFEENYAIGHHYDPDVERNASAKLKALYKKEQKGAMRELRKDNKFLAGEKAREQKAKDEDYNARMRKQEGSITAERAEEKAMEREKARDKRKRGN
ncbi:hypothetical protein B9479_003933 [Cryptococcus floricola]|uniref:Nucleolar protein 14 n=1 Tax=Cryptococcus floricola TaxID=2591691 RepID=A0A5D3AZF9_9TREE|nr:hypothetical protein B9479_003933 [Cryptococcus floricola]